MTQDIPRPIGMIDMFGKTKWGGVVACCSHQVAEEQADGKTDADTTSQVQSWAKRYLAAGIRMEEIQI